MRKNKNQKLIAAVLLSLLAFGGGSAQASVSAKDIAEISHMKQSAISELKDDSRVFKTDSRIDVKKVTFQNHYGFDVAGHLYLPANFDRKNSYQAVVVSGPFGAVKEQASGLYAQELAKNGFVALAFDQSMTGESSGVRRNMGSPDIFTEDYSAAVDFVSLLEFVNPEQIGAVGICGLSGMAITAASNDTRIKAVVTSAMYDMSESISDHYQGDYYTPEQREIVKKYLAQVRLKEARQGGEISGAHEIAVDADGKVQTFSTMFPDKLPADVSPVIKEFYDYYVGRAYHQRAINSNTLAWDAATPYGFFNFSLMDNITELVPRPLLMITGDKAHSKYFTDNIYDRAAEPKEKIVVPDATHTDLYDNMEKIPFKRIISFLQENLR